MEIYAMFFEKLNHQKVNSPKINRYFILQWKNVIKSPQYNEKK